MTVPLCFIDTETTGLHPGRRAWEVAIIRREPDGVETEYVAFIEDIDLSDADPFGLKVGRFYDRHPLYSGEVAHDGLLTTARAARTLNLEARVAHDVERLTRGAHLVGAVPNFDAEVFADMLRRHRLTPAWHYHLIDVETLAVGYLAAKGEAVAPPWNSEDLSKAVGVDPASDEERHTALGDARWAKRIYDQVTGSAATATTSAPIEGRPRVRWIG